MKWILFFNLLTVLGLSLANPFGSIDEIVSSPFYSLFEVTGITHPIQKRGLNLAETSGSTDDVVSSPDVLPSEVTGITHQIKRRALKRVVRETFSQMMRQSVPRLEAIVILNCKANGYTDSESNLQNAYDEMKTCVGNKTMYVSPKDDFINNIEKCSKESLRLTKNCLSDGQKYYPEFLLDLAKSMVNFIYDDSDIIHGEFAVCSIQFNKYSVRRSFIECMRDTGKRVNDTVTLPPSKALFCQRIIPISQCYPNMIKATCGRSTNLDKFREDFLNVFKSACDKNE